MLHLQLPHHSIQAALIVKHANWSDSVKFPVTVTASWWFLWGILHFPAVLNCLTARRWTPEMAQCFPLVITLNHYHDLKIFTYTAEHCLSIILHSHWLMCKNVSCQYLECGKNDWSQNPTTQCSLILAVQPLTDVHKYLSQWKEKDLQWWELITTTWVYYRSLLHSILLDKQISCVPWHYSIALIR